MQSLWRFNNSDSCFLSILSSEYHISIFDILFSANRYPERSIPYIFEPLTQNPESKGPLAIFGDDGDFGSFGTEGEMYS